jgi:hypothetical protein
MKQIPCGNDNKKGNGKNRGRFPVGGERLERPRRVRRLQFGARFDQAGWRHSKFGIAHGRTVASEKDGVHHRESAADAEHEAEKESNGGTY